MKKAKKAKKAKAKRAKADELEVVYMVDDMDELHDGEACVYRSYEEAKRVALASVDGAMGGVLELRVK